MNGWFLNKIEMSDIGRKAFTKKDQGIFMLNFD